MFELQNQTLPTIDLSKGIEFGLYTLGDHLPHPRTKERISAQARIQNIIELAVLAEEAGFDIFQVGESHQAYFVSQSHLIILAAIAQATQKIKIASGVTTIGVLDPVRVFEDAATIDLISDGRMEIVAGRASRYGSFELLAYGKEDFADLFEEKFDLLLQINNNRIVNWEGKYRPPIRQQEIIPRPNKHNASLPIWRALGNTPLSAQRAGVAGVPVQQAYLAGAVQTYRNRIQLFRQAAEEAGHDSKEIPVAASAWLYVRESVDQAFKEIYPYINEGFKLTNGQDFPKRSFAQGKSIKSVMTIGDSSSIIEKILYQQEAIGFQRFSAQIDFAGMSFAEVKKTLYIIADKIMPAVKKYTKS